MRRSLASMLCFQVQHIVLKYYRRSTFLLFIVQVGCGSDASRGRREARPRRHATAPGRTEFRLSRRGVLSPCSGPRNALCRSAHTPRRTIIRQLLSRFLLPLLAILVLADPADAAFTWCTKDPVIRLNGTTVNILISVPEHSLPLVIDSTEVIVATPPGVRRDLVLTDDGFNGHGEKVFWSSTMWDTRTEDGYFVFVHVRVPVSGNEPIPVRVDVRPENGARKVFEGSSSGAWSAVYIPGGDGDDD